MIKLNYVPKPIRLTDEFVEELTELYKNKDKNVWNKPFIKEQLIEMSANKCCYCECNVAEESKYMEVEHFFPKSIYPDLVIKWTNLLPSCKRCNGSKGNHDTGTEPIIHPVENIPSEHLTFKLYRLYGKSTLGKTTIDVLKLNDRTRLVLKRALIGDELIEQLDNLQDELENYLIDFTPKKQRKIAKILKNLMLLAIPSSEYSATMATVLLHNESYKIIKSALTQYRLWDDSFKEVEEQIKLCQLPLK